MIDVTLASVLRPGVAILAGAPGSGRTWLALELAAAAHSDGGDVLYITDEPSPIRLQATFERIASEGVTRPSSAAALLPPAFISLPHAMSEAHVAILSRWIASVRRPSLIVLDPLRLGANAQSAAPALSAAVTGLAALALSAHPLTILGVVPVGGELAPSGIGAADQVLRLHDAGAARRLRVINGVAPSGERILAHIGDQWLPDIEENV